MEKNTTFVLGAEQVKQVLSEKSSSQPKDSLENPENFSVSRTEKGRYRLSYKWTELSYSLATKQNADNMIVMTQQALVQYKSCEARREMMDSIVWKFVDCKYFTEEKLFSGMSISIDDGIFTKTSVIQEEQFRKALERIIEKRGNKTTLWIETEGDLHYFWKEFVRFVNTITTEKNPSLRK